MATLSTFRTEIAAVLGLDTGTAAELALIDQWVNEGVLDILVRGESKVLPGTMSLTAGQEDYTLDTAILSMIDVYVTSGGTNYALERVSPADIFRLRRGSTTQTSPPRVYATDGGNLLMVYPTPDAADTLNTIYVPRPATLSAAGDTPSEIPAEFHKLVAWYALWRGSDYDDDASAGMGDRYLAWYENGLREMRRALNRKGGHRLARAKVSRRPWIPHDPSVVTFYP